MNPATSFKAPPVGWNFDNSYARLPPGFFSRVRPTRFPAPRLVLLNHALGRSLGLDFEGMGEEEAAALFAGQVLPPGSEPLAQAYAGHQYGGFTILGDGRAILLGEHLTPEGVRVDIQFKGSGETPYSRRGDGRAALGPMLREYLISEAMHALGIPTTRSLAVVTTGETVYREQPLPGAVLTRVASSHIRVGTFQYAAARLDQADMATLMDDAIARHAPALSRTEDRVREFFRTVVHQQAALIAQWQLVGFVHGVMNTDNMAIGGETIDYGPCAFMDAYDPATVFSSIDRGGRYAYGQQPAIATWNLARWAEAILPLLGENEDEVVAFAQEVLQDFGEVFEASWTLGMGRKLGFAEAHPEDRKLAEDLLGWMHATQADFTNTFDDLTRGDEVPTGTDPAFVAWYQRWLDRLKAEGSQPEEARARMAQVNPVVIPRNHRVEEALVAAAEGADLTPFLKLLAVLQQPFTRSPEAEGYRAPPAPGGCRYRTFCGT